MELLSLFADLFLHLDQHLLTLLEQYGAWVYALLFLIVFAETGLVVTPFLPGDSLLFVAGTIAGAGGMNVALLSGLLLGAAILGDTLNYHIGQYIGPKVFVSNSRLFKREHLERTHHFYEKYGGKTIVLARFVPIIRTFAPFIAGIGHMSYGRFLAYNVVGGVLWVALLVFAGFYFGNIPLVRENLSVVVLCIVFLSISPAITEYLRHRFGGGA